MYHELTVSMPRWMRIDMPCVEVMMAACGRLGDDAVDEVDG